MGTLRKLCELLLLLLQLYTISVIAVALKPWSYDSASHRLTGVECRATSIAKNWLMPLWTCSGTWQIKKLFPKVTIHLLNNKRKLHNQHVVTRCHVVILRVGLELVTLCEEQIFPGSFPRIHLHKTTRLAQNNTRAVGVLWKSLHVKAAELMWF